MTELLSRKFSCNQVIFHIQPRQRNRKIKTFKSNNNQQVAYSYTYIHTYMYINMVQQRRQARI